MSGIRRSSALAACLGALAFLPWASAAVEAETLHVTIAGATFSPSEIAARVGDVVEWSNEDIVLHTATDRAKGFDIVIEPDAKGSTTLTKAGKISYYCRYHPNMTGVIAVSP
jgi:plastocyanin